MEAVEAAEDKSTALGSFLTGAGGQELVEDVVDKVGLKGVAKLGGVACGGVMPEEAATAAAAAKAAAAMKELCKMGVAKKAEWGVAKAVPILPPKVGLRILSMEKVKGLSR